MSKMSRLEANREILRKLSTYLESYPVIRFGQALINLNIIEMIPVEDVVAIKDPYYNESTEILNRMRW